MPKQNSCQVLIDQQTSAKANNGMVMISCLQSDAKANRLQIIMSCTRPMLRLTAVVSGYHANGQGMKANIHIVFSSFRLFFLLGFAASLVVIVTDCGIVACRVGVDEAVTQQRSLAAAFVLLSAEGAVLYSRLKLLMCPWRRISISS